MNTLNSPGSTRNPGMTLAQHLELTAKLAGMNPDAAQTVPETKPAGETKTAAAVEPLALTDENILKVAKAESPRLAALLGASADYGVLLQDLKTAEDELAAGIGGADAVKVAEENLLTFVHAALVEDPDERAKVAAACGVVEDDDGAPSAVPAGDGKTAAVAPAQANIVATVNKFLVPAGQA